MLVQIYPEQSKPSLGKRFKQISVITVGARAARPARVVTGFVDLFICTTILRPERDLQLRGREPRILRRRL